jgi:hypothetical protein
VAGGVSRVFYHFYDADKVPAPAHILEINTMATMHSVPRSEWRPFFDRMSTTLLRGKWAEIEVASLENGDQIIAEWIPMIGVTYDSRDDLVDVALDRIDHLIRHPNEIVVEEGTEGLVSIAVTAVDGTRHIVRLKQPPMLPPGESVKT